MEIQQRQLKFLVVALLCGVTKPQCRSAFVVRGKRLEPSRWSRKPGTITPLGDPLDRHSTSGAHVLLHNSLDSRQLEFLSATSLGVLANADHGATNAGLALLPALGSSCIMLTIVALLYSWEKSVAWARETLPGELRPVVESILGEIGGLGFVGLLLQTLLQSRSNKEIVF